MWAGGARVVHDGGVALHPRPAAVLAQEPVVAGCHLALHQYCNISMKFFCLGDC